MARPNSEITVEEVKEICTTCGFKTNFGTELNKYGVGRCLRDYCDNHEVAPYADELAEEISGVDPESEDEWD